MPPHIPYQHLAGWARTKPTISAVYVFGSFARGEATPDSDLDLAFAFTDVDNPLSELIENATAWKRELTAVTGIEVKDLRLHDDAIVLAAPSVQIYRR